MSATQPEAAAYSELTSELDDYHHLFQCNRCGHFAGDPRTENWYGTCPACERVVRFYRIIE